MQCNCPQFTDLSGTAEQTGDLKSVVLHSMTLASVKSDFEVPVGVKLTGVDNSTYSLTGEAFSTVIAPKTESNVARVLQKDDVALGKFAHAAVRRTQLQAPSKLTTGLRVRFVCTAYEFSRKFVSFFRDAIPPIRSNTLPTFCQTILELSQSSRATRQIT